MTNTIQSERNRLATAMESQIFDLLIIGGGIVGAGIARDAAMRGLRTVLVDQHDFGFGTSSRSSRLLHGGIRYLSQGRIGLVREASLEKSGFNHIAPHLAQPLAFIFPAYQGQGWPLWQLQIGVKIYDMLCSGRNFGPSSALNQESTLSLVPAMKKSGLRGAVRYFDALTNDARLVIDNLRSAVTAGGSVMNYTRFIKASKTGRNWNCSLTRLHENDCFNIQAKSIVNATGPWADQIPNSSVRLRLTKGIHLVLDRNHLPVSNAVVITEGKRILFVIPWGERLIVGTTDTDYQGSIEAVRTQPEDVEYLFAALRKFFPDIRITESDVISSWAGLRPLIADSRGRPSDISRSHQILHSQPGWWDVAGGKLTTYRLMAEQTVDKVIAELGVSSRECQTANIPLIQNIALQSGSAIVPPPFHQETVEHYCSTEWALHLDDIMMRRTSWHYYCTNAAELAHQVLDWMASSLNWDESQKKVEWQRYLKQSDWPPRELASLPNMRHAAAL